MSNWLDAVAGVTVVHIPVYVFALLWPVERLANQLQGSGSPRMSCGLRVVVVS